MKNKYFFNHKNSRFFRVSGEDSITFIQNLITNDINKCKNNDIVYSCLLTPQGKFLADFFIFKNDDSFYFETDKKYYKNLINKLNIYKLRSNIDIKELENIFSYSIFNFSYNFDSLVQNNDPRNLSLGKKVILSNKILLNDNNLKQINENEYHEILIKNSTPYSHLDMVENKSLLLENNFDNINAIDWDKGCYVGQEITARMKYRSLLKKKIYPMKIIKGDISIGSELIIDEKKIGYIVSKANSYIFALLNIEFVNILVKNNSKINLNDTVVLDFLN
jgi:folate-binding protein YgfZ